MSCRAFRVASHVFSPNLGRVASNMFSPNSGRVTSNVFSPKPGRVASCTCFHLNLGDVSIFTVLAVSGTVDGHLGTHQTRIGNT